MYTAYRPATSHQSPVARSAQQHNPVQDANWSQGVPGTAAGAREGPSGWHPAWRCGPSLARRSHNTALENRYIWHYHWHPLTDTQTHTTCLPHTTPHYITHVNKPSLSLLSLPQVSVAGEDAPSPPPPLTTNTTPHNQQPSCVWNVTRDTTAATTTTPHHHATQE